MKRAAVAVATRLQQQLVAAAGSKGNTLTAVYTAVRRALGKGAARARGGAERMTAVRAGDCAEGERCAQKETVQQGVAAAMARQSNERHGFYTALEVLLDLEGLKGGRDEECGEDAQREWLEEHFTWGAFSRMVTKAGAEEGVGRDGFNAYLLRVAPEGVAQRYFELLKWMTVRKDFPPEFAEWECVLAMKKGEDRHVVHRRRDLWLVPHAQKLVARVVGESYDGVADTQVPGSQGGWEVNRGAPSMHVPLVVQKEICWEQGRPLFRAFVDMGQFFPTIVREVQYRVERRMGVAPAITAVMRALQDGARGSTVTAYGRTESWALQLGVGQGCVNATRRAKLQVAIIQRAVSQLCEGFDFADGAEE